MATIKTKPGDEDVTPPASITIKAQDAVTAALARAARALGLSVWCTDDSVTIKLPSGQVTLSLPDARTQVDAHGYVEREEHDGHTAAQALERLAAWVPRG